MQKFHEYDLVYISKDLGNSMRHFLSDRTAIVIGSYADKYGRDNDDSYTLYIQGNGEVSWYYASQLTLIEKNRIDLLEEWKLEIEQERKLKGDLDWVFANGNEVLAAAHGASIQALADCFGLTNLWGNGEGITYHVNAMNTLAMAKPYLENNDKAGWIAHCKNLPLDPPLKF